MSRKLPPELKKWVDARKRFKLSHAQVQMARELELNPKTFGGLANKGQQPWKAPLTGFIEQAYLKAFGKTEPDRVRSVEDEFREMEAKRAKDLEETDDGSVAE